MVLSTHAVVGAAVGTALTGNPVLAFGIGFVSHHGLDMIPHWDYDLWSKRNPEEDGVPHKTMVFDRTFILDLLRLGTDTALGCLGVLSMVLFAPSLWPALLAGLVGGLVPDVLQFGYFVAPRAFRWTQLLHETVHAQQWIEHTRDGVMAQIMIGVAAVVLWGGVMIGSGVV